jgi:choline dehydrogenase-like flavoprotein
MSIAFFETMRGELRDAGGDVHDVSFEMKADGGTVGELLSTGEAHITGVVHAPPWADYAALEGTVRISPILRRTIEYDFTFQNADWEQFRLFGQKDISWLRPLHSMTHLEVTLEQDGGALAEGELRFSLSDLPSFAASWGFYGSSTGSTGAEKAANEVSDTQRALLRALVEASFPAGARMPRGDKLTVEAVESQLAQAPAHVERAFWAGLRWLDILSMLLERSRFHALSTDDRREFLVELCDPERGWLARSLQTHLVVQLLTMLPKAAHFARPDYLEAIGHPPVRDIGKEDPPRYLRRVVEAEDFGEETELRAHVVVVGTGAGGAAVANELAKKGLAVAIVEEGRYQQRHDFVGSPMERVHQMYRYQAMNFTVGTPVVIPQGRVVGGTTTINSGTCFRTPDHVLDEWRADHGFPDDFRPERYHQWSEEVDQMLQVGPGDKQALGRIADVIARGAEALGHAHGPLPRNAPGCPGAGECILGCPEGAKRSTDVSYIPAALKSGAELYCGLPVTRILMHGKKAVGVEARGQDRNGEHKTLRILADRVVIACGSLLTPILLRDNGIRLPMLGKNLSVHPGMGLFARMGEDLQPWNAIPQGYGIHAHEDDGIRYEGYYLHPQIMSAMTPFVGDELARWMDDFHQIGQFGFMVRDRGDGFVKRGPGGKPLIGYKLSPESIRKLKKGTAFLARVFLEAGASEVFAGVGPHPVIRSEADAQALLDAEVSPFDFRLLGAHPLGTCQMGPNQKEAVVDFDYRVFGTDNLHVVDGSVVPTSLGVNPQMTIMSFALRAGDVIGDQLGV